MRPKTVVVGAGWSPCAGQGEHFIRLTAETLRPCPALRRCWAPRLHRRPGPRRRPAGNRRRVVRDASATGAQLWAKIDLQESETTYRFEYGHTEAHGISVLIPDGRLGAGSSGVSVSASPIGLSPATTYHYRVVAIVPSSGETLYGADTTFTTQLVGGEFVLPDGRQWELVSLPNKHGAGIEPINGEGGLRQATAGGGAFTYIAIGLTESNPVGNTALEFTQLLSTRRSSGGWESKAIATPHNAIPFLLPWARDRIPLLLQRPFSGAGRTRGETPLPPLAEGAEKTIYVRSNSTCGEPGRCFVPLVTASNVQPGAIIGRAPESERRTVCGSLSRSQPCSAPISGSPDGQRRQRCWYTRESL